MSVARKLGLIAVMLLWSCSGPAAGRTYGEDSGGNLLPDASFELAENTAAGFGTDAGYWVKRTYAEQNGREIYNAPDSKSTLSKIPAGLSGKCAAAMTLAPGDQWMYMQTWYIAGEPFKPGTRYLFSLAARADKPAQINLFTDVWRQPEKGQGEGGENKNADSERGNFVVTPDWQRYEICLFITADSADAKRIRLIVQDFTPGVRVLLDDVCLEKLP